MCLELKPAGFKFVYKVYETATYCDAYEAISPYRRCSVELKNEAIIKSGRKSAKLTPKEKREKRVHLGLHAYTSLAALRERWPLASIIVQMRGELRDFVAYGNDEDIVYTKLRVVKFIQTPKYFKAKIVRANKKALEVARKSANILHPKSKILTVRKMVAPLV